MIDEYLFSPLSRIYRSEAVLERMQSLKGGLKFLKMKRKEIYRIIGTQSKDLTPYYRQKEYMPNIVHYMRLATLMGWDITRDVSYKLYMGEITREEIRARWRRLDITVRKLSHETQLGYTCTRKAIAQYSPEGYDSLRSTGRVAATIKRLEIARGLSDIIDIEN